MMPVFLGLVRLSHAVSPKPGKVCVMKTLKADWSRASIVKKALKMKVQTIYRSYGKKFFSAACFNVNS